MEESTYTVKGLATPVDKLKLPLKWKKKEGALVDANDVYVSPIFMEDVIDVTKRMRDAGMTYLPPEYETIALRKYRHGVRAERSLNTKKLLKWKEPTTKLIPPAPINDPEDDTHEGT